MVVGLILLVRVVLVVVGLILLVRVVLVVVGLIGWSWW